MEPVFIQAMTFIKISGISKGKSKTQPKTCYIIGKLLANNLKTKDFRVILLNFLTWGASCSI